MTREELEQIIEKYKNLSAKFESQDEEKFHLYDYFTRWLQDNIDKYADVDEDSTEDEEHLWFCFHEQTEESKNWDLMFPNGDEDDSITDWMTKN